MMLHKGDRVSVLDEAIEGTVLSVSNHEVLIETIDGFTMTYFVNELIKSNVSNELSGFISTDKLYKALHEKK